MIEAFEKSQEPWADVEKHVGRYAGMDFSPDIIDHAKGTYLFTESGEKILDFTSGQMSSTLGHSNPEIVTTLQQTVQRLDHLYSGMLSRPNINLSKNIASKTGGNLKKVIPLSTGSEVNEAALRMAKLVTGKFEVVSFNKSWHGVTQASAGATYASARKSGAPTSPGQLSIPTPYTYRPSFFNSKGEYDWRKELDYGFEMVDAQSVGSLAACIVEPIVSGGGILVPPKGYLAALKEKCRERGMLLIFDEAQTSLGRTGEWFAYQYDDVEPDILTLSKTLGSGLPLAALVTTDKIEKEAHEKGFLFYTSHVNDPLVAAVGCTVMNIIERDNLCQVAKEKGKYLHDGLQKLVDKYDIVGDARGRGLLQGLEIIKSKSNKEKSEFIGDEITKRCYKLGLHMNIVNLPGMGGVFRIAPPLTVSYEELDIGLAILEQSIKSVQNDINLGNL
ncbi:aspartate aminotransferase family protein [Leuconostoc suionicum]|uniref:aspartate aminotransferase family protein n=1 Tax=Leuconostoc suionicum TaxID=1511761 RepID=UPI0032DF397D